MPAHRQLLLPLAPRPPREALGATRRQYLNLQHSEDEWTAMYPHLERKYVRERKRLRHVISEMQEIHGFKAT
jgi:hypothetical protein